MRQADIPCDSIKSHNLSGTLRVHSIKFLLPGGGSYRLTIGDKTLIDPELIRVEIIHYTATTTLIRVLDYKKIPHQFWVENERKTR